jgi:RND family efflux transporter MFP subunit
MVVARVGDTYIRTFPGKVEASRSAELSFQVAGVVVELPVKEGQSVARGQVIARLRQDEFRARRNAAQGQLDQARAALDALQLGERSEEQLRREAQLRAADAKLANAKTEFERHARLLPSGSVSRAEYELAETAFHVAQEERKAAVQLVEKGAAARKEDIEAQEGQVRTLQARLAEADVQLRDATLRAPYNGVIGRLIEQGQLATPNRVAIQFQNVSEIDIVADVPEAVMSMGFLSANVAKITAGFTNAPGVRFPVRVREIAQLADPVTQTFPVRFTMRAPRQPAVFPGMTATVEVTYRRTGAAANRIPVPISAVFKKDSGEQVVWVIGPDETVRCRAVSMGNISDGQVEILSGLRPGERIAVAGAIFLREGMKVRDLDNALGGGQP